MCDTSATMPVHIWIVSLSDSVCIRYCEHQIVQVSEWASPTHGGLMTDQLVVGAGYIGRALAAALVERGDSVTLGTRSGTVVPGARALEAARLSASENR